jgi:hypothetical protein
MMTTSDLDVVQRLLIDKPSFHLDGEACWDALPQTLQAIRRMTRDSDVSLEVGVGVSSVVFAASGAHHTAISPDPSEHQRVQEYCERIGIDHSRIRFATGLSDDVLPSLLGPDRTLDVAFIDGAHSFPFPVIDWYYIARSLKVGGRLLMDDIPIPAVAEVFHHMTDAPNWRLDGVFDARAASFTLLAPPDPEDDWSRQPFNKNYPDFGFVGLPERLWLSTAHRVTQVRRIVGQRYPRLRELYKRVV